MKIILHLAISADGFIAKPDGDSDWVAPADEALFIKRVKTAGCLVVGSKTFAQYQGVIYPVEGVFNIVLTKNAEAKNAGVLLADSPAAAVELANENNCAEMMIAGGSHTSAAFLEAGLVDEIFLSVHPIMLGQGMKLFEGTTAQKNLTLLDTKKLTDGLVELHYKV